MARIVGPAQPDRRPDAREPGSRAGKITGVARLAGPGAARRYDGERPRHLIQLVVAMPTVGTALLRCSVNGRARAPEAAMVQVSPDGPATLWPRA
jgi:hypothetical protein